MEQCIRIGVDTSKHLFQLHGVNAAEQPVLRRQLRREKVLAFFAQHPPTLVALEACGASHHWIASAPPRNDGGGVSAVFSAASGTAA